MSVVKSTGNQFSISFNDRVTYGPGRTYDAPAGFALKSLFANTGTLLDQCNLLYWDLLTFVASTPQTLNLKSLPNLVKIAASVVFARVKFFAIRVNSTNDAAYLEAGAEGSANEWLGYLSPAGAKHTFFPGTAANDGFIIQQAPNTTGMVVGSASRLWKLAPSAHAFTADILIAGCDA